MAALNHALELIHRGIQEKTHLGCQLYVSRAGREIANMGIGEAQPGVPMQPDSLLLCLSAAKPFTAVAIAQLWEKGRFSLEDPVAWIVPEFGASGKDAITIHHLLTHMGGIRNAEKCDAGFDWREIIDCICGTAREDNFTPGERAAYHPSSSWYILGEIIQRVDGRSVADYLQEEVFARCGMRDSWIALPSEAFQRYGTRLAWMFYTDRQPSQPARKWNTEKDAAVPRPGRSGRATMSDLGRFYETLLALRRGAAASEGASLLRRATVRAMTERQRSGKFDDTFQQVIDWGLGFAIDSKRYGREMVSYGFGRFASDETFGHGGAQSSCAFADPAYDLVVAWAFNGLPGERPHQRRGHELNSAIYTDLGLEKGNPVRSPDATPSAV